MSRKIFYNANKKLETDLVSMGFKLQKTDTEANYFTNKKGNQIKVDSEYNRITLLNNKGFVVDFGTTFTKLQLDKFAEGDN